MSASDANPTGAQYFRRVQHYEALYKYLQIIERFELAQLQKGNITLVFYCVLLFQRVINLYISRSSCTSCRPDWKRENGQGQNYADFGHKGKLQFNNTTWNFSVTIVWSLYFMIHHFRDSSCFKCLSTSCTNYLWLNCN